jgi:ribose/xylose/arabinose/galactoside ABC-type transport system permease subunit
MDKKIYNFIDEYRAILLLLIVAFGLSLFAPNFLNAYNITSILKGISLNAIVVIGFTLVFIIRELDLSIGSVVMLGGMLTIGIETQHGIFWAVTIASLAGIVIGFVNGYLVAKIKIHSFIVTLGMMSIVLGLMHIYSNGDSLSTENYDIADWLDTSEIPLLPPLVIITLVIVFLSHFILTRTTWGRGFFSVGGNQETAWLAGLNKDVYIISAFTISGLMSALGGAIFALTLSSMPANITLANSTLMAVLAATIIGGTLMSGGKGSIAKSYFAVLLLGTIFNGLSLFGFSYDIQIFVNGAILAIVVLYEAWNVNKHNLQKGQNPKLLN